MLKKGWLWIRRFFLGLLSEPAFYGSDIPEFESSEAFIQWAAVQDFDAIYLDLPGAPTLLYDLALDQSGKALTLVYADENVPAYIYLSSSSGLD